MSSKSEIKRQAVLNPLKAAERIAELEAALETFLACMSADTYSDLEDGLAALKHHVIDLLEKTK